jgi:hypothetical protein
MPSEPLTGSLLRVLAAAKSGARVLELGIGTDRNWTIDGAAAGWNGSERNADQRGR